MWLKANQRKGESPLLQRLNSRVWTHTCQHSMKDTEHRQFLSLGWHLNSVHSLRSWVFYVVCMPFVCLFSLFCLSEVKLDRFAASCGELISHTQLTSRSVLGGKGDGSVWAIFPTNPSVWRSWVALPVYKPSREAKYPEAGSQTYFRNGKLALKYQENVLNNHF